VVNLGLSLTKISGGMLGHSFALVAMAWSLVRIGQHSELLCGADDNPRATGILEVNSIVTLV
jgi:hypothetical protein